LNKLILILILILSETDFYGQVKIRLFASSQPESVIFGVTGGAYEINSSNGEHFKISKGELVLLSKYNGRLAVKLRNTPAFASDSIFIPGVTGEDSFSLMLNGELPVKQYYSGDLKILPDLGTILMINTCGEDEYIAGVVRAEGGSGRNIEYFKTQAVLVRTYLYKYLNKHIHDGYNLCDNTHCQAYNGLSADSILNEATLETKGQVILDHDSILIISAFHSNCGGETASSEDVWLTDQPYLKSIRDPYCAASRNSSWQKKISGNEWTTFMQNSGYSQKDSSLSVFKFIQNSRVADYKAGSFTMPLTSIRNLFNLRSTFFSVLPEGDSILLRGRGYGHGVGLCQEGAMAMAAKGFNYRQIIDFYFAGVIVADIRKVKK
jgi:stage II sporulation protein D